MLQDYQRYSSFKTVLDINLNLTIILNGFPNDDMIIILRVELKKHNALLEKLNDFTI